MHHRYTTDMLHRARMLLGAAKTRASKAGIPWEYFPEALAEKLRGTCEQTGLPFVLDKGKHPQSPSLDRIVPEKGYTPENVQVVCWMYNAAKHSFSDADVLTFARAVVAAAEGRSQAVA